MNMNYNYPTTIFRSILPKMYQFLVKTYIFTISTCEIQDQNEKL